MDKAVRYPLAEHAAEQLIAASGRSLQDVTLEAAANGDLTIDDLRIDAATLRAQAAIAHEAGYPQLAANLTRAAELTMVPNDEVLRMYEQLRPGRASYDELLVLAERLEQTYQATACAALVREAAEEYRRRSLVTSK